MQEIIKPEVDFHNDQASNAIETPTLDYKDEQFNRTIEVIDSDENSNSKFISRLTSIWNRRKKSFKP